VTGDKWTDLKTENDDEDYNVDYISGRHKLKSLNLLSVRVHVGDGFHNGAKCRYNNGEISGDSEHKQS
jgi:hypothetical protein